MSSMFSNSSFSRSRWNPGRWTDCAYRKKASPEKKPKERSGSIKIKGGIIMIKNNIALPEIVPRDEWLTKRKELLKEEKS